MNKEILYDTPRIVVCHDLYTPEECAAIINDIPTDRFERAMGYDVRNNEGILTDYRSNSTYTDMVYKLVPLQQRLTKFIESELEGTSSYKKGCIETPLQVQRYDVGQQYKPHVDFFNGVGAPKYFDVDRIASVIVYLNDDFEGGETYFTALNIDVKPKVGTALLLKYDYPDDRLNLSTFHCGMPVTEGVKYIVTAFIRAEPMSEKWNPRKEPIPPVDNREQVLLGARSSG
jgi:prolyl 4-hydroxylase